MSDFDFEFDTDVFTGAAQAWRTAHARLQEMLAPADDLVARVAAIAVEQGFVAARVERRLTAGDVAAAAAAGARLTEWVAIVTTGRGDLVERVEIPENGPWPCGRCGQLNVEWDNHCGRCEAPMVEAFWTKAFRALGVAV